MCEWDENSGVIVLSDSVSIRANMPRKKLAEGLEEFTGKPCFSDDPRRASAISTCAFAFAGSEAAILCSLHLGRLRSIEFHPLGGTAAQQRARLFDFLRAEDPCRDTMDGVRVRYPFGTAWIATDRRGGDAVLRITYAVKE